MKSFSSIGRAVAGINHVQELVTTPPYHLESNQVEVQFNGQILSVDEEGVAAVFRKLEISMRSFT